MPRALREYDDRRARAQSELERQELRSRWIAAWRGVSFLAGLGLLIAVLGPPKLAPGWLAIPLVAFLALVIVHARAGRAADAANRRVRYHTQNLERLGGGWPGIGADGAQWLDPEHPYAIDLDVLGPGSLFQLLSVARTWAGKKTLAAWLGAAASAEEVRARQEAVRELIAAVDAREDMALAGPDLHLDLDPAALSAWGEESPLGSRGALRLGAGLAAAAMIGTLVGWLGGPWPSWLFVLATAGAFAFYSSQSRRIDRILRHVETPATELGILAHLLVQVERQAFEAPRLRQLVEALRSTGQPPSARVKQLSRKLEMLDWSRNMLFGPIAALLLWRMQVALSIEAWRLRHAHASVEWLEALGEIETLHGLARHAYEHEEDVFPGFVDGPARVLAQGVGHPLLSEADVVRNDVELGDPHRLLVVSGSNMSGKSTLLRALGTNVVLAQAGGVVRASSLELTPIAVAASIRAQDSLLAGSSRFRAELDRMRHVLEVSRGSVPLLFLLDEIFHGTHSHDRRLGAQAFLARLLDGGAVGLVTTHDLALTKLEDGLHDRAINVHFEDQVEDGQMAFDYKMRPGVVEKSNALALMRSAGLID